MRRPMLPHAAPAIAAAIALLTACGGGGGGGGKNGSPWGHRVTIDHYSTTPTVTSASLRAAATVVGEAGQSTNLVFTSDGTPVVGYYIPTVWDSVAVRAGELRAAQVVGDSVQRTTLASPGTAHWSKLSLGTDDAVGFYDIPVSSSGERYDVPWFTGTLTGGAAVAASPFPGAGVSPNRGFVRSLGVPVRSPAGTIVTPVVAYVGLGEPTQLRLWSDGWASSDVIYGESEAYGPVRLQWGYGCVPSLALDLAGSPVVAYEWNDVVYPEAGGVEPTDHVFDVAQRSGGAWSSETALQLPVSGVRGGDRGPFLGIDLAGTIHLVVFTERTVYHASKPAGGAWSHEALALDVTDGSDVAFALEGGRVPAVLYQSASLGAALARQVDGVWQAESVDAAGTVYSGALAVDAAGTLWAVYDLSTTDDVYTMLARRDSGGTLSPTHLTGLAVSGTHVVERATGKVVQLRGTTFTAGVWAWDPANPAWGALSAVSYRQVEEDLQRVHGWGANAVTLYLNWFWFQSEDGWAWLDQVLEWARRADVYVIPSLVIYPNGGARGGTDFWASSTAQQQLLDFWTQLALRYQGRPEIAGLDVLNEPWGTDSDTLAAYHGRLIDAVRGQDPGRLVFVEGLGGNPESMQLVSRSGLVYVAHYYHPFAFTAEGFPWIDAGNVSLTTRYPGTQVKGKTAPLIPATVAGITPGGTTGWTQVETPWITVPASAEVAMPSLYTSADSGSVWFDGVEIAKNGGSFTAVLNGNLELPDALHWVQQQEGAGTMARVSDQAHDGSWSLRNQGCTARCAWVMSGFSVGTEGLVPVAPGDQVKLRFWTRTANSTAGSSGGTFYFTKLRTEYWDKDRLRASISGATPEGGAPYFMDGFAQQYDVPLFVGEFAPSNLGPSPDVVTYASDVMDILNERGIGWSYYQYRGDADDLVHNYMGIYQAMRGTTTPQCSPPIGTGTATCLERSDLLDALKAHLR